MEISFFIQIFLFDFRRPRRFSVLLDLAILDLSFYDRQKSSGHVLLYDTLHVPVSCRFYDYFCLYWQQIDSVDFVDNKLRWPHLNVF